MDDDRLTMQWMVAEGPDGAYLINSPGYMATPREVAHILDELIRFAKNHADRIADNNARVDEFFENLRHGIYSSSSESTQRRKKRYLYMFKSGEDRYKIGVTTDVDRRLKELNNRPYPVELYAVSEAPFYNAFEAERTMHEIHEDCRINGEWFKLSDEHAQITASFVKYANIDYDYYEDD